MTHNKGYTKIDDGQWRHNAWDENNYVNIYVRDPNVGGMRGPHIAEMPRYARVASGYIVTYTAEGEDSGPFEGTHILAEAESRTAARRVAEQLLRNPALLREKLTEATEVRI